ncbi:hypothetical protein, partial [Nonomuraea dietziae]|uniref:hypothetical protein n=1 Tax=Nonomuraea dietziae TaxID=65515 RepID=UPI00343982D4
HRSHVAFTLRRPAPGDEFSARDAMSAARNAMMAMKDMHRATTFASGVFSRTCPQPQGEPICAGHPTSGKIVFSEAATVATSENTHG